MKSVLLLFISLSVSVHAHKTDDTDGQSRPNNSIHLDCFDVFIPLINRLTHEAKDSSGACVINADAQKERELISINRTRSELHSEVKRMKETLSSCSTQNDHLGYFDCLKGILEIDRRIVSEITMKSSKYSNKIKEIEDQQINCFRQSVFKVKEKSSNAIHSLQYCLTSGESAKAGEIMRVRENPTTKFPHTTPSYYDRNQWNQKK